MKKLILVMKQNLFYTSIFVVFLSFIVFLYANPFKSKAISVSIFNTCSIDNIQGAPISNGYFSTNTATRLVVQGWVGDAMKITKSDSIFFQIVDNKNDVIKSQKQTADFARPDVAGAYGNSAMEFTGFNADIGMIETPGDYTVLLGSINGGQTQICTIPFMVKVS
jgi:hypothetical protein